MFQPLGDEKIIESRNQAESKLFFKEKKTGYEIILEPLRAIAREAEKNLIEQIPFKRTTIGPERSMPPRTDVWFITSDELQSIKQKIRQ